MKISVLKFGGNSLKTIEIRKKVINIIKSRLESDLFPVVVVSAMGRKGDPYSTDNLLNILPEAGSERHKALISSCGEIISATLLAEELIESGYPAIALTGWQAGILTNNLYSEAKVENVNPSKIIEEIKKGIIPVICGFQGITATGEITTLGRGGSDTTAALIARALEACQLELFKDVEGLYTADPHKVKDAQILKTLDYNEIAELSGNGAQIVHNPAIRQLSDQEIPLLLGNTWTGEHGTCIQPCSKNKPVTAVTSKSALSLVTIEISTSSGIAEIFSAFSDSRISLDFISVVQGKISFVIEEKYNFAVSILDKFDVKSNLKRGFCKITVTGSGMTGQPGVMSKLTKCLESENINIEIATDSYSTISCLIKEFDEIRALNIIHNAFDLKEKS
ncbi:MAG: aspartate kinase [Candidatus Stygibacter frigidus]|nr:aspartate kinase [Candidatus Stygibacter frigidus]